MSRVTPEQQIQFLVRIQRLLGEGRFVASYKFALLQALADLAVEKGDDSGDPLRLTVTDIAEKFIQYYWRQTLPLGAAGLDEATVLRQNTGRQAAVINLVARTSRLADGSLVRARAAPDLWNPLVSRVAEVVRVMPLWKLQTVGDKVYDFLYPNTEGAGSEIELRSGVTFCLRKFHALIQDLIQGGWVRFIRSIRTNQALLGDNLDLRDFLFGSERENLEVYRRFLKDIQAGECFYCRERVRGTGDVDHFIPWVKYPVDLGHNFVLAHPSCNRHKRDYLAAENHLQNWFERNDRFHTDLSQFFREKSINHDLSSSSQITCWAYEQAADANASVWILGNRTREIGTYWRNLCGHAAVDVPVAADRGEDDGQKPNDHS